MPDKPQSEIYKILILEDNYVIRFVIKHLLLKSLSHESIKIFSSGDGIEGLGYLYITYPEIVIVDTTLPKYGGLEVIDYVRTNDALNSKAKKVIVISNSGEDFPPLQEKYVTISKKDPNFFEKLKHEVSTTIEEGEKEKVILKRAWAEPFGKQALKISNAAEFTIQKGSKKGVLTRIVLKLKWTGLQILASVPFSLFQLLATSKDKDLNVAQRREDLFVSRVRSYPTLAVFFAAFITLFINIALSTGALLGLLTLTLNEVKGATYTWDGEGTTNNWSECTNWTTDTCPSTLDTVTFDATSTKNATVDTGFGGTVSVVDIQATYSGTISQERALTVSSTFTQAGGFYNAVSFTLDINGNFTLNSGADFTASSGTSSFARDFTVNAGGSFTHNSGTITFDLNGANAALSCNNTTFNLVTINASSFTKTIESNCNLPLGNDPLMTSGGGITLNGTLSGTGTLFRGGPTTINATGVLSGFSGLVPAGLTVTGANLDFSTYTTLFASTSGVTVNSGGTLTLPNIGANLDGSLTISNATLNAPSGSMSIASDLSITGTGAFNANGGTLTFDGPALSTATIACNNVTFNRVTFNIVSGTRTVSSNCNLPMGNSPTIGGGFTMTLNGTLSGTGMLNRTTGLITIGATGNLSGFSGINLYSLTISKTFDFSSYATFVIQNGGTFTYSVGTLTLPDGADISGVYTQASGTLSAPSGTLTFGSTFSIAGTGTFIANGGTVIFDQETSATVSCNNQTLASVLFTHPSPYVKTVHASCQMPLGADPNVLGGLTVAGTLNGTGRLSVVGSLTISGANGLVGFNELSVGATLSTSTTLNLSTYNYLSANTITNTGTGTLTLPNLDLTLAGSLSNNSSGTITTTSQTLTLGQLSLSASGTFNHNNGGLVFSGGGSIGCNNKLLNSVSFLTNNYSVANGCNLPLGNNPIIPGTGSFILQGTLSGTGTLTMDGTITITGTALFSGFTGLGLNNLTVSGSGTKDLSTISSLQLSGNLANSTGVLNVPPNTYIMGNLTQSSGTFVAPPGNLFVLGDVLITNGTFTHSNGTLILEGNSQTLSIPVAGITFYNLRKNNGTGSVLTFPAGKTVTVSNTLELNGESHTNLILRSSTPGSQWSIDPQGSVMVSYLDIQDSQNVGETIQIYETGITSGNNTNWNFYTPTISDLSPEGLLNGDFTNSANPTFSFAINDLDLTDTMRFRIQVDNNSDFASPEVDYLSGLEIAGNRGYTVGQATGTGSYSTGEVGQSLIEGEYYLRVAGIDQTEHLPTYQVANSGSVAFAVDLTAPTGSLTISDNPNSTDIFDVILQLSAADNLSGVSQMIVSQDSTFEGAAWEAYSTSKNLKLSSEYGVREVYIKFEDQAGNQSTPFSSSILLSEPTQPSEEPPEIPAEDPEDEDTFAPDIEILYPIDGSEVTPGTKFSLVITDDDQGVDLESIQIQFGEDQYTYTSDEIEYSGNLSEYQIAFTLPEELSPGTYSLEINASDLAENLSEVSASYRVDETEEEEPTEEDPTTQLETSEQGPTQSGVISNWVGDNFVGEALSQFEDRVLSAIESKEEAIELSEDINRVTVVTSSVSMFVVVLSLINSIPVLLLRFGYSLLTLAGLRSKGIPFGFVYDSISKDPLSHAVVRIFDDQNKLIKTEVTDFNGVFTTAVASGEYKVKVSKNGYRFPSTAVALDVDENVGYIYKGELFKVSDPDRSLNLSIPIDAQKATESKIFVESVRTFIFKYFYLLLNIVFMFGALASLMLLILSPSIANIGAIIAYVGAFLLNRYLKNSIHENYGSVKDKDGQLVPNLVVGLISTKDNQQILKKSTDVNGRFRFIVKKGSYRIEILSNTYKLSEKSPTITVKKDQTEVYPNIVVERSNPM